VPSEFGGRERNHLGQEIAYRKLFSGVITLKMVLLEQLHPSTVLMLQEGREVSLVIFARGYELAVAYFAILAIGGIVVPTSR